METISHDADFCVVGGGLAGLCAAVSAARRGIRTVLMQERPVLGGNASSEIRMWVCGANGRNMRETGLIEEIRLANLHRNPTGCWSLWDSILYEKARFEPNLTLLLNCSCVGAQMAGRRLKSVKGWQMTTQSWQLVRSACFADCSGDSILAPLTGAEFRMGREGRGEFGEDIAPPAADRRTMGMSCLMQLREASRPVKFIPPAWAYVFETDEDLQNRCHDIHGGMGNNFWWIEVGGEGDSIRDTEQCRDELLKIAFGVWDHIKNRGEHAAENWTLDWLGFLPGKRESRRYVGDHMMTQNDVRAGGNFPDIVAYGGWTMDDHHPSGFWHKGEPTIFHSAPSPFGIPYRSLYSRNIENLFCAGRNISATHSALSSTRVMATCATLGQAVGTAAALAVKGGLTPRGVYEERLAELQDALQDDDCYLPGRRRSVSRATLDAVLSATAGEPGVLRNGWDRPVGDDGNAWEAPCGSSVSLAFARPVNSGEARLVFDSGLEDNSPYMPCAYALDAKLSALPPGLVKAYRLEALRESGRPEIIVEESSNIRRLARVPVAGAFLAVTLTPLSTWGGGDMARVFAFEVK